MNKTTIRDVDNVNIVVTGNYNNIYENNNGNHNNSNKNEKLITNCKVCGKELSKKAELCLNCGHNYQKEAIEKGNSILITIFFVIGIIVFIGSKIKEWLNF